MKSLSTKVPVDGTIKYNILMGTDLSDTISGGQGTDLIYGGIGSDHLYAGSGKDVLVGGTGQDFLFGGNGNDTFVYNAAADAGRPDMADVIGDFKSGQDKIDVHAFMAGGHFIGAAAFAHDGTAQISYDKASGLLQGDVNGDGVSDFSITLANHASILASDFTF